MKRSIKRQMIILFTGLIVCVFMVLFVVNVKFLGPYYIQNKETEFVEMYERLDDALLNGTIKQTDTITGLQNLAEKHNISFLILEGISGEDIDVITNVRDMNLLKNQLMGYLLNQTQKTGKVLESTKNYQIYQAKDPWMQTDYIEMWGVFGDGSHFLIRSPLESIQESASISNRFLMSMGCVAIIVCGIFVWYFSKKLTNPIRELADLSNRMADLDFEAKYTSGGVNEIGELGDNFNRMSEKLKSTISELKSANNQLQEDIERKDKLEQMRNDFMGNVSHELKTPIALIQGYAEGLKDGVTCDMESMEFYCDVIMDEASKMNLMVKNLLTLNQLEFGNDEVIFERFDVSKLIQGVIQSCEILIQQADAKIDFIGESPVYVWADEFKTEQVIRNYLTNAIHHVDNERRIEVRVLSKDDIVRVTVFNSGHPIPQEDLAKLWDKFYKVDKAHTREYGGNGIGLSIVKAIMESFHQKYGVRNFDNGVEFWFELDGKSALHEELNAIK